MRLDRFLAELNVGTRSQVKDLIRKSLVTVNGTVQAKPEAAIDPEKDQVCLQGAPLLYSQFQYYLLNKPGDVISATRDKLSETVLSLLPEGHKKNLFPVGRLDKDTEGLLIITNDGQLSHRLLSPKKHVEKTYAARIEKPLSDEDVQALEEGVDIGDDMPTLPAKVTCIRDLSLEGEWIHLSITEGRYHQIKRMLEAVGNKVLDLKRIRFGGLSLDPSLKAGECRELTADEFERLRNSLEIAAEKKELISGKKAVILDLDGTMVDSMWIWGDIDVRYLARFNIALEDVNTLREKIEGMSFHETALYFKETYPISDSVEQMKAAWSEMAWDKYAREVPLKPGIAEFLEGCKKQGILLGIATSNARELVDNILAVHGIKDYFKAIVTGSEVTKGKPAPDIYLKAAEELGAEPGDCLVFEDLLAGLASGRNAGMTVCAVADPYSHEGWDKKKAAADYALWDFYDFF